MFSIMALIRYGNNQNTPRPLIIKTNKLFNDIMDFIIDDTEKGIIEILTYGGYGAVLNQSIGDAVQDFIEQRKRIYEHKFSEAISDWNKTLIDIADRKTGESLREASKGLILNTDYLKHDLLPIFENVTTQNVSLFKTITSEHWKRVEAGVMDSILNSKGLEDLVPFFESYNPGIKNYGISRALDQTRKSYQATSRNISYEAGIRRFQWLHSNRTGQPRKRHLELDKGIFEFDNPPYIGDMYGERIYGFPAQLPNCHCFHRIIFEFEYARYKLTR